MANFCLRSVNDASTRDYASCVGQKATWLRSAQSPSRLTLQTLKLVLPRRALIPRLKIPRPWNQKNNQQPWNLLRTGRGEVLAYISGEVCKLTPRFGVGLG